ncbi:hypothetical protein AZF07_11965 [Corynebacterium diphtheriae subsp. lausannense]|nr:hypothetical protein AZF07_11965 [Corynebacterium diphtheriae subsp. lausannense]
MTICFKNQLNALADTHILIDGASRSWPKDNYFAWQKNLESMLRDWMNHILLILIDAYYCAKE